MSLFRAADAAWCCYPPERDLSSGIFGRAVQFGIAPIVRQGSVLGVLAADVPNAISLRYGDAVAARAALLARPKRRPPPPHQLARERDALRTLLLSHFGRDGARS
jgi:hypothetical protein